MKHLSYSPRFFLVFAAIQLLLWLGHWFVYLSLAYFLHITNPMLELALMLVMAVMSFSFTITTALSFRYYNAFVRVAYTIAAVWLGYYWLLLASIGLWLAALLLYAFNFSIPVSIAAGTYLFAFGLGTYGLWHGQQLYRTRVNIRIPHLPPYWAGKKIVFIADTHFGHVRGMGFAHKLAHAIASEQPDLVLIGGDFYDGTPLDYQAIARAFAAYTSTHGTYFITGNHEEFRSKHPFVAAVEAAGMHVLNNERVVIEGLTLIGVDYHDSSDPTRYNTILKQLTQHTSGPILLLKHVPNLLAISEAHGAALQLSGHTHRGQTWPFSYITRWLYNGYDYGLKNYNSMQVYTTSGAGTWGPPQRLGTRAEIAVLTLEPNHSPQK